MALEIARRLVDGVWRTRQVDEDAGGSGASPVSCVLARDNTVDVGAVGDHPILWDGLYDNYHDFNTLNAVPAGLGLDFDFDGSSATITITDAGVWSFSYQVSRPADADWRAGLSVGLGLAQDLGGDGQAPVNSLVGLVLSLPSGVALSPVISTSVEANALPYSIGSAYCLVTRLG